MTENYVFAKLFFVKMLRFVKKLKKLEKNSKKVLTFEND